MDLITFITCYDLLDAMPVSLDQLMESTEAPRKCKIVFEDV